MSSIAHNITIDCADPWQLGQFWAAVTGHALSDEDQPGDPEALIQIPGATPLLFVRVPDAKTVKNRLHLDLTPTDRTRDEEVERVIGLGATVLADRRNADGSGWVTLADPEGNEFCVVRSEAERH